MAKKRPLPPPRSPIDVALNGKTVRGYYTIAQKIITVHRTGGGTKSTQVGASRDLDALARLVLFELEQENG